MALSQGSRICGVPAARITGRFSCGLSALKSSSSMSASLAASAVSMSRVDRHRVEVRVVLDHRQLGAELVRVREDVLHRLQLGHVVARLVRHVQVGVRGAQARLLVARDGAAHVALAPVVGGQRQVPVAEHAVQALQVIERRAGGGQHVAAVVAEEVLLQVVVAAGGRHELPHAGGARAGDGLRVERALDEGQQRQFAGHAAPLQFLDDVEQVLARAVRHALHVVGPAGVPLLLLAHQVGVEVAHREAARGCGPTGRPAAAMPTTLRAPASEAVIAVSGPPGVA